MRQPSTHPRRATAVAAALAVGAAATAALSLAPAASAADVPQVYGNVTPVGLLPDTALISGTFAHTGNFFYTSGAGSVRVYDTTDPELPVPLGALLQAEFENESMTYAERPDGLGGLKRYVFVGNDLAQATVTTTGGQPPAVGRVGGDEAVIIDVSNPAAPVELSRVRTTTSTHTLQCVTISCEYAYTAGNSGKFSILDLRDMANPVELKTVPSPAAKGPFAAGHYWDFDTAGIGWHTGGGGAAAFDVTDPVNPVLLNSTNSVGTSKIDAGETANYNDFILHNSMRPNGSALTPNAAPALANGNVLIVTEEDYTNDGDEAICANGGSIETWYVPDLAVAGDQAADTGSGTIEPLDKLNPIPDPARGFCSAHWFDYHQDGFLAQGFYNGGLQIIDVRDPMNIKSQGFARNTAGATEVWDAYWVPVRDADGVDTGQKTNLLYTADFGTGVGIFRANLDTAPTAVVPEVPRALLLPLSALLALAAAFLWRRRSVTA